MFLLCPPWLNGGFPLAEYVRFVESVPACWTARLDCRSEDLIIDDIVNEDILCVFNNTN